MQYVKTFCLRYNGVVLTGPNAGKKLDNYILLDICIGSDMDYVQREVFHANIDNWVARAQIDIQERFSGKIEICESQFVKKDRGFKYNVLKTFGE